MRRDGKRLPGLVVLAASAALAAGCATGASVTAPRGSASHPVQPVPTAGRSPRQRAEADAAAILKSFVPPPGARRLAKAPAVPGGWLKSPQTFLVTDAGVDDVSFWAAPGKPVQVLAWETAHVPRRYSLGDADFGPPSWDRMYDLPPVPGVLTSRSLVVEVVAIGPGQTGIRADAEVGYQPPRPAGEEVPSVARVVTIAEMPAGAQHATRAPASVTITDPKIVGELAGLIDSLPVSTIPGTASCPALPAASLRLTFRARRGGRALAVARTGQSCDSVAFAVNGRRRRPLTSKPALNSQVLKIAGLSWALG